MPSKLMLVALACAAAVFLGTGVEQIRWGLFTTVQLDRICADGQRGECVRRLAVRVAQVRGRTIAYRLDDRERLHHSTLAGGPVPRVGREVVLDEWHGRVVAVQRGSSTIRTRSWPKRSHDLTLAAVAWLAMLACVVGAVVTARRGRPPGKRPVRRRGVARAPLAP